MSACLVRSARCVCRLQVQRELQQAQLTVDCQTREISTTKTQQKLLEMKYEELQSEMEKLQTSKEVPAVCKIPMCNEIAAA